jgi:hypothetical protein
VPDIEIAFKSLEGSKKHDRIDVLLYNKNSRLLQFVEAKRFSDSRLVSTNRPEVIGQLERYASQIKDKKQEIIDGYGKYIENLNMVFDKKFPHPQDIERDVILWIFDYKTPDQAKLNGLKNNPNYKGVRVYENGDAKEATPKNIWEAKRW